MFDPVAGAPGAGAGAAASSPPLVAIFRRTTAAPFGGLPPAQRRLPGGGGNDAIVASDCATQSPGKIRDARGGPLSALREAQRGVEAGPRSCACAGRTALEEGGGALASAPARCGLFPKVGGT